MTTIVSVDVEKAAGSFLGALTVPVFLAIVSFLTLPIAFYDGWVVTYLWRWFVIPSFQLPELTIWNAAGMSLLVRHLCKQHSEDNRKFTTVLLAMFWGPATALIFGYLVHWWSK